MDGIIADLANISRLAKQYDALLMVDDSHAVGCLGKKGQRNTIALQSESRYHHRKHLEKLLVARQVDMLLQAKISLIG